MKNGEDEQRQQHIGKERETEQMKIRVMLHAVTGVLGASGEQRNT